MRARELGMFGLLGLIWGSSFLWIKVGLGGAGTSFLGMAIPSDAVAFGPLLLVTMRLAFGLAGLALLMVVRGLPVPREPRLLANFAVMGLLNTALPFTLITWGETRIASGLASVLNGTVPLFTIVIAHFWLHDERLTPARVAGLVLGFLGVVVLVSPSFSGGSRLGDAWGAIAVIGAAMSYGSGAAFSRKHLRGQSPLTQSFMSLGFATLVMLVVVTAMERPTAWPSAPAIWLAAAWLGLLGSCVAYLLYFSLINAWGATRSSLVTYVFPVVGLLLGATLLDEPLRWQLFAGAALVIGGIVLANFQSLRGLANRRALL
jgi:drug/metabolite transporter (DMT)-like permease